MAEGGTELLHLSQRTGIAVDALAKLKYIMEQSGLETGDLEMALRRMNNVLAKADDDSKQAVATLAKLGIQIDDLEGMTIDQKFLKMAEAVSNLTDATKRSKAAQEIFGRQGMRLLPLFAEGAEGVQKLAERFERLGLSGVTLEGVKAAQELQRAWVDVAKTWGKIWTTMASTLLPGLTAFAKIVANVQAEVIKWVKANKPLIATVVKTALVIGTLGSALVILGTIIRTLNIAWLASTAAAVAWKVVVVAATAVAALFNAQLAIWNFLLDAGAVATAILTTTFSLFTAATWLLNAALTAMNALLAPELLLAFVGTVAILGAALLIGGAALWGVVKAGQALYEVLKTIPVTTGPLAKITGIFGEWIKMLGKVYEAATVDLKLAWKLLAKDFEIAVAQMEAMLPPLWTFLLKGFAVVWKVVAETFEISMLEALYNVGKTMQDLFSFGVFGKQIAESMKKVEEKVVAARASSIKTGQMEFVKLLRDLEKALPEDSPLIKRLKEEAAAIEAEVEKTREAQARGGAGKEPPVPGKIEAVGAFSAAAIAAGALAARSVNEKQLDVAREQLDRLKAIEKLLANAQPGLA